MGNELLENRYNAPGRVLAQFIGKLRSFRTACPEVVLLARELMRCLTQLPRQYRTGQNKLGEVLDFQWRDYAGVVMLSDLAIAEIRVWLACIWKLRAAHLARSLEVVTFTDACETEGYGAVITRASSVGNKRGWEVQELVGGAWESKVDTQSCMFELRIIAGVCEQKGEQ